MKDLREFFHPTRLAVFGVGPEPRNLAKNIVANCRDMGFQGDIFPVGRKDGDVSGEKILTDPDSLPTGIDLGVVLVPAVAVPKILDICARKGIRRLIISTAGYRELDRNESPAERSLLEATRKNDIRFIGPNCIGVICTNSGLCTPFNPLQPKTYRGGRVSVIAQSGGVATQSSYIYSEEHVGFSKIISAGNKLDIGENDFIEYLMEDDETDQIHMYLESIDHGRELIELIEKATKPVVVYKSNTSRIARDIAWSHTAALANDDRVVEGALRQAGAVRVGSLHEMTVSAKALSLPPLKGNRLAALSLSGGFSVILGDACEQHGFECPEIPRGLLDRIEGFRRGGVIRMSNPMDLGDVHNVASLTEIMSSVLALDHIDGMVVSFLYSPEMFRMFQGGVDSHELILGFFKSLGEKAGKPIGLSFFTRREDIEVFKRLNDYPVFNDAEESVRALAMLRDYTLGASPSV